MSFIKWFLPYRKSIKNFSIDVLSFEETVNRIINDKVSVARFGDGEFRFLLSLDSGDTFEKNSKGLEKSLKEVLKTRKSNLLICLPGVYDGLSQMRWLDRVYWQREVSLYLQFYHRYLSNEYHYGEAFFSRPYIGFRNDNFEVAKRFELIKRVWADRNVLIIEGELTRFGVGNDLLDSADNIQRILAPATNSFESFDAIFDCVTSHLRTNSDPNLLILISLGPTATVLASKISQRFGIQAIDIGHLDLEYEWFCRGDRKKVPIVGKYVNESSDTKFIEGNVDESYSREIIHVVKPRC